MKKSEPYPQDFPNAGHAHAPSKRAEAALAARTALRIVRRLQEEHPSDESLRETIHAARDLLCYTMAGLSFDDQCWLAQLDRDSGEECPGHDA